MATDIMTLLDRLSVLLHELNDMRRQRDYHDEMLQQVSAEMISTTGHITQITHDVKTLVTGS